MDLASLTQDLASAFRSAVEKTGLRLIDDDRDAAAILTVALLDIGLPVMDGYELSRRFGADSHLKTVRLVAVTGYGQERDPRRSRHAGFTVHLVKPIKVEDLRRVIELE
jgi:CheY-like chemotaxis protein